MLLGDGPGGVNDLPAGRLPTGRGNLNNAGLVFSSNLVKEKHKILQGTLRTYLSIPDRQRMSLPEGCQSDHCPCPLPCPLFLLSLPVLEEAEADKEEKGGGEAVGWGQRSQPCLLLSPLQALWEAERSFSIKEHSEFVITSLE